MDRIPGPAPIYLLAGGRRERREARDPLLAQVLADCRVPHPSVAYVGAASGDDRSFFIALSTRMRLCGAGQVTLVPLVSRRAGLEKAQAILERADMVFISGGDVEAGMQILERRLVLPMLRGLYERGTPFFGLSAGSIMLAREWVRWENPDDDTTARPFPCMGLAPVLCDTHGEAEAWEELRTLLRLMSEGTVGYGIPSGAGLRVRPEGTLEALDGPVHCYVHRDSAIVRLPDLVSNAQSQG